MSISKTAFVSILIACWIVGLLNQFQDWDMALKYLLLSGLMVAAAALRWQYSRQVSKARIPRRRD